MDAALPPLRGERVWRFGDRGPSAAVPAPLAPFCPPWAIPCRPVGARYVPKTTTGVASGGTAHWHAGHRAL